MKHLTTLLLTLLVSGGLWADDEFPIELTCEITDEIWYLYFHKDRQKSWYMPHEANPEHLPGRNWKEFKNKKNTIKFFYEIKNNSISVGLGERRLSALLYHINRFTLGIRDHTTSSGGQCYKGFNEYKKQI